MDTYLDEEDMGGVSFDNERENQRKVVFEENDGGVDDEK